MSNLLLRIVLACYLAIWSPALCCCGVKAAMGVVTSIDVGECHGIVAQASGDDSTSQNGCCAHKNNADQSSPLIAVACDATTQGQPTAPCRCHESIESKVRLDTGAKIVVPAPSSLPLASAFEVAFIHSAIAIEIDVVETTGAIDSRVSATSLAGPRALVSLHAQRTLLLI